MIVAYIRVSTDGQSLDAQRDAVTTAGAKMIYAEKESGAKSDRPELARALKVLQPGDELIVTRIDRLARSTLDLHNILAKVAEAGAGFRSINEPMIDTTSPHGRLLLAMLAAIGEFERTLILARTSEGKRLARERGVKFGKPHKLSPVQMEEIRRRYANGEGETPTHLAKIFNVGRSTIQRVVGISR